MNPLVGAFGWIFDPSHWTTTALGTGIGDALVQHLILTGLSLVVTVIIALPIGLYIGHSGRGRSVAIIASNIARALPSLGILGVLLLLLGGVHFLPGNYLSDLIVFVLLGIPPLLAGAYAGLESVDRLTIDAARAIGMTEWQILVKVEIPLGAALIVGGFRSTTLQVIATVTIASLYGQVSLGTFITSGLDSNDLVEMSAGAVLVAALALIVDGLLAIVQRFVVPRGVSRGTSKRGITAGGGRLRLAANRTPITEGN
jgi:osmoprotectant transport system permease protein